MRTRAEELREMVGRWLASPTPHTEPPTDGLSSRGRLTPLGMIQEWRRGCSNVEQVYPEDLPGGRRAGGPLPLAPHPEDCPE